MLAGLLPGPGAPQPGDQQATLCSTLSSRASAPLAFAGWGSSPPEQQLVPADGCRELALCRGLIRMEQPGCLGFKSCLASKKLGTEPSTHPAPVTTRIISKVYTGYET